MSKYVERIPMENNCMIIISHYDDDDCSWIVRVYKKGLFRKKRISSAWFFTEIQARAYAKKMAV